MHELSLCQSLMHLVLHHAAAQRLERIHEVVLRVGAFSGADEAALQFAFPVVSKDTLAYGSRLVVEVVPGVGLCGSCGHQQPIISRLSVCERCGFVPLAISGGDDVVLARLRGDAIESVQAVHECAPQDSISNGVTVADQLPIDPELK